MTGLSQTVLYVEDHEGDRFFMQFSFLKAGVSPSLQMVNDGQSAIDYLSGNGSFGDRSKFPLPRVVLLDLKLPCLDGFDVLKWIRSDPTHTAVPVIMFSSSSLETDRAKANQLGATEFWTKPSSAWDFMEVAKTLEDRWFQATEAP